MAVCAVCGRESPDDFGFCPGCGGTLAPPVSRRDVRKVVTVLFCDLTGSTAIGDSTDPEPLRALMSRYYDSARAVLERHGGTVEKFVGDAVMAVFGIPVATEHDALRAVRAAVELRDGVHALGLEARIGVNTGEVVAGEGDTLVTGDAVNVAARLEQAAGPGEVLLGPETVRLVRDAVETEPVELTLKGKSEPVPASRLLRLDVDALGHVRHLDRPLVGRVRERERLRADFADAAAARTCRLFTLIGPAGVGKSRLVEDFLEHVGDSATVARARCLSYGEGITYWPLVEILLQLGRDPEQAIQSSPADTQLATRALLEEVAAERPLVLVLDDLQWAEAPLLDLVDHLADWSREAPLFLLCVARPELLDARPGWGGGKLNATSILLEPLTEEQAAALADTLLAGVAVEAGTRDRILASAEGNPLFLEEMAALARESRGAVDVPPTIQALLQARLDTLDASDRAVIERGAVEGKVFHRGAVTALAPALLRDDVPTRLLSLVRRELVRPDRSQLPGDDAFRFRHLLIRDAAYESLPKATRADLHERFADWLDEHGSLVEQDEIVGYHLEQASRHRQELDAGDARVALLGSRSAARLGAAGAAAFGRADLHATRNLLGRAIALLPEGPDRRALLPDLIEALVEVGEHDRIEALVDELERGSDRDRAVGVALRVIWDPIATLDTPDLARELDEAQAVLATAGDDRGVARCEQARGVRAWGAGRAGVAHEAYQRAYDAMRRAGSTASERQIVTQLMITAVFKGADIDELERLREDFAAGASRGPLFDATIAAMRARHDYLAGTVAYEELEAATLEESRLLHQTGSVHAALMGGGFRALALWLEGDLDGHERLLRERISGYESLEDRTFLANVLGELGLVLAERGDVAAATEVLERARTLAHPDDVADQLELDALEAYICALRADTGSARALLDRVEQLSAGIELVALTDAADYWRASVLRLIGDVAAARAILERLEAGAEARGFKRFAARYRRDLAELS